MHTNSLCRLLRVARQIAWWMLGRDQGDGHGRGWHYRSAMRRVWEIPRWVGTINNFERCGLSNPIECLHGMGSNPKVHGVRSWNHRRQFDCQINTINPGRVTDERLVVRLGLHDRCACSISNFDRDRYATRSGCYSYGSVTTKKKPRLTSLKTHLDRFRSMLLASGVRAAASKTN